MNRTYEELESSVVLAPASVATETETASAYISGAEFSSIDFHVQLASLSNTKTLTVAVYTADDAGGTNATKIGEDTFTASDDLTKVIAVASARVTGDRQLYYGVKFQHNEGSGVVCAVTAHGCPIFRPADNGWVLTV